MKGIPNLSEAERRGRERQQAMSIAEFCERYSVGRTTAYEEIKAKRLRARKCGRRTIVTEDDADDWLQSLPSIAPNS